MAGVESVSVGIEQVADSSLWPLSSDCFTEKQVARRLQMQKTTKTKCFTCLIKLL